jgi:hypothetical protein
MADFFGDKMCGPTHHTGCECHEARRNEEIAALKKQIADLLKSQEAALTTQADFSEENVRLREALEWYATADWTPYELDMGERARKALGIE